MPERIEFKFASPGDSPGYQLAQLTMLWQREQKRVLDPLNLTHTQFVLLAALGWLSRESDAVTQVDIADLGNTDRMMVSKVLRTLEKKGFLSRREHPTDARAKVVVLTEAGAEVLRRGLEAVEAVDAAFFSVLGDDLKAFNQSMLRLTQSNKGG